jgi:hypothetical protein
MRDPGGPPRRRILDQSREGARNQRHQRFQRGSGTRTIAKPFRSSRSI